MDNNMDDETSMHSFEETDPLFIAIENKNTHRVSTILAESGQRVNQVNPQTHESPLHAAIKTNDVSMCKLLKEYGASFGAIAEAESNTALHVAASTEASLQMLEFILKEEPMYIDAKNDENDAPLHVALEANDLYDDTAQIKTLTTCQLKKAQVLLEAGAQVDVHNFFGDTPLMMLASVDEIDGLEQEERVVELTTLLKIMFEKDADLTVWNLGGESLLHRAAANRNPEVLATVMEDPRCSTLDVNARDSFFCTPLEKALNFPGTKEGVNIKKVKLLLSRGANFDSWSIKHDECVFATFIRSFPVCEISDVLQNSPASITIDSTSYRGRTCLHNLGIIETQYFAERVALLIQLGADVNVRDVNGCTPLHLLCNHHSTEFRMLEILITGGADLSIFDNFGRTPLHYASMLEILQQTIVSERSSDVVKRLLASGASLNDRDVNGCSPLILAGKYGFQKLADVLLEAGADTLIRDCHGKTYAEYQSEFKPARFPTEFQSPLDEGKEEQEVTWDPDEWRKTFWDSFPGESLIPRVLLPMDELALWADRARDIRGEPDKFIAQLLETPNLGQIVDYGLISSKIDFLIRRIASKIEQVDPRFSADVQLSGSNFEGTKIREPNEFDYLFKLKHFASAFEVTELYEEQKSQAFVRLKNGKDTSESMFSDLTYPDRGDLIGLRTLNRFSYLLRSALSDGSVFSGLDLYFLDENSSVTLIPNLEVMYVGGQSKEHSNLRISVDIVPCFLATVPKEWNSIAKGDADATSCFKNDLAEQGCLVIPKNRIGDDVQHVSVYMKESSMIRALPPNAKLAYVACKLLSSFQFCPDFFFPEYSDDEVDADDNEEKDIIADCASNEVITSYMVKTALLHMWTEPSAPDDATQSRGTVIRTWVWRIFDWIENRTKKRDLTSLGRPWEGLLLTADERYCKIPYVLAVCEYIKRIVED